MTLKEREKLKNNLVVINEKITKLQEEKRLTEEKLEDDNKERIWNLFKKNKCSDEELLNLFNIIRQENQSLTPQTENPEKPLKTIQTTPINEPLNKQKQEFEEDIK
jgi:hypothetical protein